MPGRDFEVKRWTKPYWPEEALRNFSPFVGGLKQDPFNYTFHVAENYWVIEAYFRSPLVQPFGTGINAQILGPEPKQLALDASSGSGFVLLCGKEPFGIIEKRSRDYGQTSQLYFRPARQIHKGELGRIPEIETPLFAREAPSQVSEWTSKRDRKRGYIGWARLSEVADMINSTPWDLLLDYWEFVDASDREGYAPQFQEVWIDIILADVREEIHKQVIRPDQRKKPTRKEIEAMARCEIDVDWNIFWIRRGFARTVLMLNHFGYVPESVEISNAS